MKIAVLSTNKNLYSTRRLVEAGEARGHEMPVINHKRCYMNIVSSNPSVHYNGEAIEGVEAIIPRIGASVSFYGTAVVRQFEVMGVYSVNESVAITRSRDKLRALQLLSRKGIGLPVTGFASSPGDTDDLLDLVGGRESAWYSPKPRRLPRASSRRFAGSRRISWFRNLSRKPAVLIFAASWSVTKSLPQ